MTTEQHERLKQARKAAGIESATDAAKRFGWKEPTYFSHENGSRGLTRSAAARYAKAYKVSAAWLLTGEGEGLSSKSGQHADAGQVCVDRDLLLQAISFALRAEGVPQSRSDQAARTIVSALEGQPLASVDHDPLRSFQVRYELEELRSDRPRQK